MKLENIIHNISNLPSSKNPSVMFFENGYQGSVCVAICNIIADTCYGSKVGSSVFREAIKQAYALKNAGHIDACNDVVSIIVFFGREYKAIEAYYDDNSASISDNFLDVLEHFSDGIEPIECSDEKLSELTEYYS